IFSGYPGPQPAVNAVHGSHDNCRYTDPDIRIRGHPDKPPQT
ncbi:MAG: hypothetical protein XD90_1301, partial [Methanobacterium sp. 42_16]